MANKYWIEGPGDWSDTAHWSLTDGGVGGADVPSGDDEAFIADVEGVVQMDSDIECEAIYVSGNSTLSNSESSFNVTLKEFGLGLSGPGVIMGGGIWRMIYDPEVEIAWDVADGFVEADDSTLVFDFSGATGEPAGGSTPDMQFQYSDQSYQYNDITYIGNDDKRFWVKHIATEGTEDLEFEVEGVMTISNPPLKLTWTNGTETIAGTFHSNGTFTKHNLIRPNDDIGEGSDRVTLRLLNPSDISFTDVYGIDAAEQDVKTPILPFPDNCGEDLGENSQWLFACDIVGVGWEYNDDRVTYSKTIN